MCSGVALAEISPFSAVINAHCTAASGPSRDPRVTHRRQRAADDCLGAGKDTVHTRDRESLGKFEAKSTDHCNHQKNADPLKHRYFAPSGEKIPGMSLRSGIWSGLIFFAPGGIPNLKSSDETSAPAFQSLISRVYSGEAATFVLVMT